MQLKGVLQVDSRTFFGDSGTVGNDGILLRRARPMLQGTVFRDFDFLFVPDFGGTTPQIYDAYVNYRYRPALQLEVGKFKTPVGFEQLQADRDLFFNERALPTDLVPNRDIGFMLHGDLFGHTLSYQAGIFNGVGDGRNSSNVSVEDNKAFAGRLFVQPFDQTSITALQRLGVGLSGSYEAAQHRSLRALARVVERVLPAAPLVAWVVLADDDTWVDAPNLAAVVGQFDARVPLVLGYVFDGPYWAPDSPSAWPSGGGAIVMSAPAAIAAIQANQGFQP